MVTPVKDGDQVITLLDVTQPRCASRYGEGVCEAVLGETGDHKCFNTRASCQDPDNYRGAARGSAVIDGPNGIVLDNDGAAIGDFVVTAICQSQRSTEPLDILAFNGFGSTEIFRVRLFTDRIFLGVEAGPTLNIRWRDSGSSQSNQSFFSDDITELLRSDNIFRVSVEKTDDRIDLYLNAILVASVDGGILETDDLRVSIRRPTGGVSHISDVAIYDQLPKDLSTRKINFLDDNTGLLDLYRADAIDGMTSLTGRFVNNSVARYQEPDPDGIVESPTIGKYATSIRYRFDQSIPDIYGRCIPSMRSVSITPGQINIGAMDKNLSPFGRRNVADIAFEDHPSLDIGQDPYFEERLSGDAQADGIGYNPEDRGQYWAKWLARNPFYNGYEATLYRGAVGQPVEDMQQFRYVIDQISGPDDNGGVSMTLKDVFSQVTDRKAKLPKASRGELVNALPDTETGSFEVVVPPVTGSDLDAEYPDSGEFRVAIGSEVIRVTRSGSTFTIVDRADIGTTLDSHDADDTVQLVYAKEALLATTIVRDMLLDGTIITADQIPFNDWTNEADEFFPNLYTGYIVKPTPVNELVGELAEQAGFSIWPEIETGIIRVRALTPEGSVSADLIEIRDILDDGLDKRRKQDSRVSQVWVYFGLIDPTEDLDDNTNYRTRLIRGDLAAQDESQYGTPAIREVYSRWIPQFGRGAAETVGDRILSLFRDPPLSASFNLAITRELPFQLAQRFNATFDREQDLTGLARQLAMVPIQIMRNENRLMIAAQELRFFAPPDQARNIFIDNDTLNFNLRQSHDNLFGPASSGDEINVFVNAVVGSSNVGSFAFDTGNWPSGVSITIIISATGFIYGLGGSGGNGGGGALGGEGRDDGDPGEDGGDALIIDYPVTITGDGTIAAGGGGGGGGSGGTLRAAGAGGGGGAGRENGAGGISSASASPSTQTGTQDGDPSTDTEGGEGGEGLLRGVKVAGDGGRGGDLGEPGQPGETTTVSGATAEGGAGGQPGRAIVGMSNITFLSPSPTIIGATE